MLHTVSAVSRVPITSIYHGDNHIVLLALALLCVTAKTDATDEEQSSDDEAPEEVSAAAATALAGRRRKAEQQARQAAPKRKRARASKGISKNAADVGGGEEVAIPATSSSSELELPSDLLLKVKSGGLQRMKADASAARELEEEKEAASATALSGTRAPTRVGDILRRYGVASRWHA